MRRIPRKSTKTDLDAGGMVDSFTVSLGKSGVAHYGSLPQLRKRGLEPRDQLVFPNRGDRHPIAEKERRLGLAEANHWRWTFRDF